MTEIGLDIDLLHCAMGKISSVVWRGTHERIGNIHAVKRGATYTNEQPEFELYCLSDEPCVAAICEVLTTGRYAKAQTVVLIGNRSEETIRNLEQFGFKQNWETAIYLKMFDSVLQQSQDGLVSTSSIKYDDITSGNLAIANAFCSDFVISESALINPSFISRLQMVENRCVGKIQMILCPPHGAFCVFGAVKESERQRGYFAAMMEAGENWARERGLPKMVLFSGEYANKINVYPKLGYTPVGAYVILERVLQPE